MIKKFELKGLVFEYSFERKSVKNINIRIRRDGSIYVSAPHDAPFTAVEQFIRSKAQLIATASQRCKQNRFYLDDGVKLYHLGKLLSVKIIPCAKEKVVVEENVILIYTNNDPLPVFEKWEKKRASSVITEICEKIHPLFKSFHPDFPTLQFRKMVSKWGVCRPGENRITFSTMLVRTPVSCIEYVICHEFVHFLHPDHSSDFYDTLSLIMPDWKERKEQLNDYINSVKDF